MSSGSWEAETPACGPHGDATPPARSCGPRPALLGNWHWLRDRCSGTYQHQPAAPRVGVRKTGRDPEGAQASARGRRSAGQGCQPPGRADAPPRRRDAGQGLAGEGLSGRAGAARKHREGSGHSPSKAARDRVRGDEGAEHVGQAWRGNRADGGTRATEPGGGETAGGARGGGPALAPSLRDGHNRPVFAKFAEVDSRSRALKQL